MDQGDGDDGATDDSVDGDGIEDRGGGNRSGPLASWSGRGPLRNRGFVGATAYLGRGLFGVGLGSAGVHGPGPISEAEQVCLVDEAGITS